MTRVKLLPPSFIPSISFFSSSCLPISSSSSSLSNLSSLCFPFSLHPCTSVISPSDSGHGICLSLESLPSMPASFSNTTTILQISFLNPRNSLKSSNFLKTSAFHSVSVCYLVFLAFNLQTVSALALARAVRGYSEVSQHTLQYSREGVLS